ncbi:NAD(P)-dependent oxidoreductase [Bacteriovorax sp. PP10]|uniref:NAD(P)-dependent oxidoreductase n=1 Tax=Bacteriovorax antarcticus TaxID=3088717 RepID=A0ABU5VZ52_9BACT|nr:NAD(P)-dependent oxidoreductase [Bacteriovorax sp. PP10]MEA9357872.1 NAD(P)-dependent oxidoreductase [Bacteriovorax sp. PP10]
MKILITGANGFVGSHLCEKLLKDGHDVFALVRSPHKFTVAENSRLTVIKGDLDQEILSWVESLPADLETCIHTAGIVHTYSPSEFYRVNAGGTENLVKNLKQRFINLHFILISSLAASGPSLGTSSRSELDMDFPVSVYGRSKKKAEELLAMNAPTSWQLSVIKPPMVIGPRDPAVLDIFKMVQGGVILLPGQNSKTKLYSFVCVFDLVETIVLVAVQKKKGIFFSANPQVVSFEQLISEIKKQLKKNWILYLPLPLILVRLLAMVLNFFYRLFPHNLRLTPDKYHELAATNWTCDGSKSEKELGQVYNYDLERTITMTLIDYKSRKWI